MEDNKLIAEFMGVGKHYEAQSSNMFNQYHTDWNCLMPVIKKCRTTEVDKNREIGKQRLIDNINFTFFTLDLLGTYNNIIEFIKWYERKPIVTTF